VNWIVTHMSDVLSAIGIVVYLIAMLIASRMSDK